VRHVITFGMGVGAGLLLALVARTIPDESAPRLLSEDREPATREGPTRRTEVTPVGPIGAGVSCEERVKQLELKNTVLEGQLQLLGGGRVEWPEDTLDVFGPEAIQAWLHADLPKLDSLELMELDCEEFPCIAFLRYAEGMPASSSVVEPLRGAFQERTDGQGNARVHVMGTPHGAFAALTLGPGGLSEDRVLEQRLGVRIQQMSELHTAEPTE
jgi:hypothetical protein